MKILVTVKRVIDAYVKIRVKDDQSAVETANMKMAMNPFDEIALEEAIRLREKNIATEIVAVSVGPASCQETLRQALAMGADAAILVLTDENFCSLNIAKILQKIVKQESPQLVLMGKQSIDGDNNQTAQMLAALEDLPLATFASSLTIEGNQIQVTREVDEGLETLSLPLPAVVSTDLRLNTPRYATLPNIMKAKHKPLNILTIESLDLKLEEHRQILSVTPPVSRTKGVILDSVETLVDKLKHEARVI